MLPLGVPRTSQSSVASVQPLLLWYIVWHLLWAWLALLDDAQIIAAGRSHLRPLKSSDEQQCQYMQVDTILELQRSVGRHQERPLYLSTWGSCVHPSEHLGQ